MASLNLHTAPPADDAPTSHRHRRLPRRAAPGSRVAFALGIAAVCTLAGVDLAAGSPVATATTTTSSQAQSVAEALDVDGAAVPVPDDAAALGELTASRSQRDSEQAAAGASQAQAEQAAAAAQAEAAAQAAAAEAAAAQAAQAAQASPAQSAAASGTAATAVAKISNSAGPLRPQAQAAANAVVSNVAGADGITLGGTRASAADPGGHPSGLAIDYMVLADTALGEAIVQYHIAHWDELGVEYVIYKQRMLSSPNGSWTSMEDRGSPTANHLDHVHVNYR